MNNKIRLILFLIILLGAFLRIYRLAEIPAGFHIDEAQVGYNAYSLWKTGRDETGKFLPTHLTLWKVDRPLGISYLTIPGIMVFGLNEFGTRVPTAVIGTLTILLVYLLTFELFKNRRIALLTSLLLTISPWHINLSRATSEAILCLFFLLLGIYFCLKILKKHKLVYYLLIYLSFIASFFFYHATRITIPFFILFFIIIFWRRKKNKEMVFFTLILLAYLIFPLFIFFRTSVDRFKLVSLFNAGDSSLVLQEQIREDGARLHGLTSRIFHNKPVNYTLAISENFASYFSLPFLVFHGGLPIRYNIPNMGLVYFFELPFLVWGFYVLFKKESGIKIAGFVILWFILGVMPASLTIEESPNINRALFMLPAMQWLTALGFREFFRLRHYYTRFAYPAFIILSGLIFWNVFYFWHQYTIHTFTHKPWFRFYEMKELVKFISLEKGKYKTVYLTFNSTEPYIYFLFYNKINPSVLQQTITEKGLEYVWNNTDNIKIVRSDCPVIPNDEKEKILAVYKINCIFPKRVRIVQKFSYPDGETPLVAVNFPFGYSHVYEELQYEAKKTEEE